MKRLDKQRLRFLEETSRDYEIALTETPESLSYLNGRGVSTKSLDRFRLGLVVDPPPEHQRYRGYLSIPVIKGAGITNFKFRCIRPECMTDKWRSPWGEHHEGHAKFMSNGAQALYNVAALDAASDSIAIAEGEPDTWILDGECDIPTIGMPSASSWKSYWKKLLKDFRTIWFFRDQDAHLAVDVGRQAAEKVQKELPQTIIIDLPVLRPGEKSDVTEVFCDRGRGFIRSQVGLAA